MKTLISKYNLSSWACRKRANTTSTFLNLYFDELFCRPVEMDDILYHSFSILLSFLFYIFIPTSSLLYIFPIKCFDSSQKFTHSEIVYFTIIVFECSYFLYIYCKFSFSYIFIFCIICLYTLQFLHTSKKELFNYQNFYMQIFSFLIALFDVSLLQICFMVIITLVFLFLLGILLLYCLDYAVLFIIIVFLLYLCNINSTIAALLLLAANVDDGGLLCLSVRIGSDFAKLFCLQV